METLRIYLILPLYHEFVNSKNYEKLHTPFGNAISRLNEIPKKIVGKWWSQTTLEWFEHLVSNYKDVVSYIISFKIPPVVGIASEKRVRKMKIFINRQIMHGRSFLFYVIDRRVVLSTKVKIHTKPQCKKSIILIVFSPCQLNAFFKISTNVVICSCCTFL